MKEHVRRLEALEARMHETDGEAYKRYLRGLSDEQVSSLRGMAVMSLTLWGIDVLVRCPHTAAHDQ